MFDTVIPRSVRLSEAPSFGKPIALYSKESRGAVAYAELAIEVRRRDGRIELDEPPAIGGAIEPVDAAFAVGGAR